MFGCWGSRFLPSTQFIGTPGKASSVCLCAVNYQRSVWGGFGPRNRGNHTKFVKRHFIRNSSDGSTGIYSLFSFHKQLRPARHKNTWCLPALERSLGIAAYNRTDFRFTRTGWNGIDLLGRHYFRFLYLAPPRESKGYCSCRAPPAPARAGSQLVPSNVSVVVSPVVHLCGYLSVCIGVCNNKTTQPKQPKYQQKCAKTMNFVVQIVHQIVHNNIILAQNNVNNHPNCTK